MNRDLDHVYFRVERSGKWESICFSDLTEEEMDLVLESKDSQWMNSLIKRLKEVLNSVVSCAENDNLPESSLARTFSDIISTEAEEMQLQQQKQLSKQLGLTIRAIGDFFDIRAEWRPIQS